MRRWLLIACLSWLFVAAAPGARQPTQPDVLFIALDDLPVPDLEGHSLVPQLRDARAARPWPAVTTHNQGNHAVRTERWRYIRYADGSEELYDMLRDPNEWTNLAPQVRYKAIVAEHRRWLPKVDRSPVPGSRFRILTRDGDGWSWEGERIR